MGKTSIEWTDASWNPVVGCTEISPGCANCYAARLASTRLKNSPAYKGLALHADMMDDPTKPRWNGVVRVLPERLEEPLHWKKPRRIFVCDMGDLFHESVTDDQIKSVWLTMHRASWHTFQVLTKRADRMQDFCNTWGVKTLTNVWLGVSVENQHFADERIPLLVQTPAMVRFISAEPLLGPLDLQRFQEHLPSAVHLGWLDGIEWVICGGESGPGARPMHPDWARSLRDQCQTAGVPFFFKQWGTWASPSQSVCSIHSGTDGTDVHRYVSDGRKHDPQCPNAKTYMIKCSKKVAGRLLDGREWNEFPQTKTVAP